MFIMLFSIEQSILAEETLAKLWSFAQCFHPLKGSYTYHYNIVVNGKQLIIHKSNTLWLHYHNYQQTFLQTYF